MARPRPNFSELPQTVKIEPVRARRHLGTVGFSEVGQLGPPRGVPLEVLGAYAPTSTRKRKAEEQAADEMTTDRHSQRDSRPASLRVHGLDEELGYVSPDAREGRREQS